MALAPMPWPLASAANSGFQASNPAEVRPHWAALAIVPRDTSSAKAAAAAMESLPAFLICIPFANFHGVRFAGNRGAWCPNAVDLQWLDHTLFVRCRAE